MKRLTVVLCLAALAGAAAWYWIHRVPAPEPFSPSLDRGAVVPVGEYRLSGPYNHDNLTVFLVHGPETLSGKPFLTLQEALQQNKAVVHETDSVNQLSIENLAKDQELYVQSGDIVKGGKQDRTLPYDTVVGPASGRVPVDSFCVEHGRWSKRGEESSGYFSSSSKNMKAVAYSPKVSQADVWRNVAHTQERLSKKLGKSVTAAASVSSLQLSLETKAVTDAIDPYLHSLGSAPDGHKDAIGYVAVVNGRIVSADVFASRSLFRKLWPKLLEGSAVEAFIEAPPDGTFSPPGKDAVRTFLADAERGKAHGEAVTERTYVQVRKAGRTLLFDSCDRSRDNIVLHRCILAGVEEEHER
jgi:hypothetical protein